MRPGNAIDSSFHLLRPVNWHLFLGSCKKKKKIRFRLSKNIFLQGSFQMLNGKWVPTDCIVSQNNFSNELTVRNSIS